MAMSDPLGDMLTRIRNGQAAKLAVISCPMSEFRRHVLEVLQKEGYIRGFSDVKPTEGPAYLQIELKYYEGDAVIRRIDRVSKPGRRVYAKIKDLARYYNGLGISILSTPRGVMSDNEARAANVGGEVLCRVF
ncbi:MAG: 30S ribosomal protein S8 [Alphaproteobacteria bacterium]|nr:30S ribosomal protein S8 [Alphaproteobacteria bacterium]